MMKFSYLASIYLIMVAAFWGATFPLLHVSAQSISPSVLVFFRFLIASIIFLPFIFTTLKDTSRMLLLGGALLGMLNGGTFIFQMISLETISASRSAFITGTSVLFVPFLAPLFFLGRTRLIDIICASICLLGLYFLTGANFTTITVGDYWVLSSALCITLSILVIQWLTLHTKYYALLTFYQLLFTIPFAAIGMISHPEHLFNWVNHIEVWFTILFCAIFATIIALFIQIRCQQYITPAKVALIFSLEPVFATVFAYLFIQESITSLVLIGGSLILFSMILPSMLTMLKVAYQQING